jgi:RNA polymerase sigma-70 factor (ECF subfamily)
MEVPWKKTRSSMSSIEEEGLRSFEGLLDAHWERVFGAILRLVGDPAEAEDLALEAFWRLYRRPPAGQDERQVVGWLYRVATNLGYNALRARSRRQKYEREAGRRRLDESAPLDPESQAERQETRRRVRRVLAEMKPRMAQVLILRHSGLSYAEIAAALEVSTGSVGTLLARAEKEFQGRYLRSAGRSEEAR